MNLSELSDALDFYIKEALDYLKDDYTNYRQMETYDIEGNKRYDISTYENYFELVNDIRNIKNNLYTITDIINRNKYFFVKVYHILDTKNYNENSRLLRHYSEEYALINTLSILNELVNEVKTQLSREFQSPKKRSPKKRKNVKSKSPKRK